MAKYNIEIELTVNKAVTSSNKLKTSLAGVEAELKQISSATSAMASSMTTGMTKAKTNTDKFSSATKKLRQEMDSLRAQGSKVNTILTAIGAGVALKSLQSYSDGYIEMTNKIKALSAEGTNYAAVQEEIFQISQRSRTELANTAQLYGRLSLAQKSLNTTQAELLKFTEAVGKAMQISGTSASTQRGVMLQLSQAIGTDIVRAEEFNSILEGGIRIAQAAADGIEGYAGNVAKLRKAVIDGEISSKQFYEAILSQIPKIESEFSKTSSTISQAFIKMNNAMIMFVGETNQATGAANVLIGALDFVTKNLDSIALALLGGGVVMGVTKLGSLLVTATIAMKTFTTSAIAAKMALGPLGLILGAVTAAVIFLSNKKDEDIVATESQIRANDILYSKLEKGMILTKQEAVLTKETAEEKKKEALASLEVAQAKLKEAEANIELTNSRLAESGVGAIGGGSISVMNLVKAGWDRLRAQEELNVQEEVYKKQAAEVARHKANISKLEKEIKTAKDGVVGSEVELTKQQVKVISNLEHEMMLIGKNTTQKQVYNNLEKAGYDTSKLIVAENGKLLNLNDANAQKIANMTTEMIKFKDAQSKGTETPFGDFDLEKFKGEDSPLMKMKEDALDLGSALSNVVVSGVGTIEDSLIEAAKTGKLSFGDMAAAIIEDLARILIRAMLVKAVTAGIGGFSEGGTVGVPGFSNGGPVFGAGTSTSDSIPAMLSNGEYVVKASAADKFRPLLETINSVPKYANGGSVGSSSSSSGLSLGSDVVVNIIDQRSGDEQPVQTQERTGPDGSKIIDVMILSSMKKHMSNGSMDSIMSSNFGVRRSSYKRG